MKLSPVNLACLGLLTIATLVSISSSMPTSSSTFNAKRGIEFFTQTAGLGKRSSSLPIAEIARQITVRVFTQPGAGSGVIIARQGQTYTVLTSEHVVADSQDARYTVLTADGMTHPARRKFIRRSLGDTDLAIVQFESKKLYRVAGLGDSNALSIGDRLYASGFPNYRFLSQDEVEDTRAWGRRAFRLTTGKVSLLSKRSLPKGYSLGYTNEVEQGMSGGPVLNERGQVVGINGRLKYPLQGIDVFTFADGTKPSVELFKQMEALSWAIPIAKFRQVSRGSLTKLHNNPQLMP